MKTYLDKTQHCACQGPRRIGIIRLWYYTLDNITFSRVSDRRWRWSWWLMSRRRRSRKARSRGKRSGRTSGGRVSCRTSRAQRPRPPRADTRRPTQQRSRPWCPRAAWRTAAAADRPAADCGWDAGLTDGVSRRPGTPCLTCSGAWRAW